MNLFTRCPKCGTAFRVHPAQLSMKGGKVRCGKCSHVFDGVAALVEAGAEAQEVLPSPQLGLFEGATRASPGVAGQGADANASSAAAAAVAPGFLAARAPQTRFNVVWTLCTLIAVAALALQTLLYFRTEIAVLWPESRAPLAAACDALRCRLGLPRRPDLMSIESSDLQSDSRRENLIVLNASLRNRAPFAQEFPALELTLTDAADRAMVRRVLKPRDYLGPRRADENEAQGIAAGAEAPVRVFFDTTGVRATGYRLYLFYP